MKPLLFSFFNSTSMAQKLTEQLSYEEGVIRFHTFPNGETSVIIDSNVRNRIVIFLDTAVSVDTRGKKSFAPTD